MSDREEDIVQVNNKIQLPKMDQQFLKKHYNNNNN